LVAPLVAEDGGGGGGQRRTKGIFASKKLTLEEIAMELKSKSKT
jgi:hypothetical protein